MMVEDDMPTILIGARVGTAVRHELALHYRMLEPMGASLAESVATLDPADRIRVRVIVTTASMPITRDDMEALPNLGLISFDGSGYEGVDLHAAEAMGIAVTNCVGVNAASVADLALGLLIASVRRMQDANAFVKRGAWPAMGKQGQPVLRGLTGRRVGIYGLGAVGEKIAQRVTAFEMSVAYHNRGPRSNVPYSYFPSLLELAAWADVLMIAVRASPENRHSVNHEVLAALGADGHVINVGRGSVIDEAALIAALRNGMIAGAGLDVFEHEPMVPESLRDSPNAVLTPHIGGRTGEADTGRQQMVLANVSAFLSGQAVPTPVPRAVSRA